MSLESLNDPNNKISHYLRYILKEAHKTFLDPLFLVILFINFSIINIQTIYVI